MNKLSIKNFLSIKSNNPKEELLKIINTTINKTRDLVNEKLWGVIREKDLDNLRKYWLLGENQEKSRKKHCKILGLRLIRVLSSSSTGIIENFIERKLGNPGVALEFFILDILMRNSKVDEKISFEKGPLEFDNGKIDFLSFYYLGETIIKIGNQLTTSRSSRVRHKDDEMKTASEKLDNNKGIINSNNFSITQIPDLLTLFLINSITSKEVNKGVGSNKNILKEAYIEWRNNGFPEGGPSVYLEEKIKNELYLISSIYREIIIGFLNFIKRGDLNQNHEETSKDDNIGKIDIKYNPENMEYEAKFFESIGSEKRFIFSLKFYITNKFLKKMGIDERVIKTHSRNSKK